MGWALVGAIAGAGSGMMLLRGGWWKLRHRRAFLAVLQEHGRVMARVAAWIAFVLPVVELGVGIGALGLLVPPSIRATAGVPLWPALFGTVVLGIAFTVYSATFLFRGRAVRCGCLDTDGRIGPSTVLRALLTAVGGLTGLLTALPAAEEQTVTGWPVVVGVGGLLVAVVLTVGTG
jgi:hypothetical protein